MKNNNERPIIVIAPADMPLEEIYKKSFHQSSVAPPDYITSLEASIINPVPETNTK